jgi:putative transposase
MVWSYTLSCMKEDFSNGIHAPMHVFVPNAVYMITAGTLHKAHLYNTKRKLRSLQDVLFRIADKRGWELRAWALFSNHYHLIAKSPDDGSLRRFIQHFHSESAKALNRLDQTSGRRVWYQYWDNCLTFESSYYARLNYVINNPVHHQLVNAAELYPFCSAGWMAQNESRAFNRKVESYKYDQIDIDDPFVPKWR